uniref:Mediator of RNA polymerase II transcription subunit 1 n=1 Tax=Rodentolepis nana TaxID=102285 RepID=A0A0R3TFA7_RODNA
LAEYRKVIENGIAAVSRFRSKTPEFYRSHVRFATLRNQLFILAQHYDLQLSDTGPLLPPGASSTGGIAWRLTSDCFSVVISAIPADGYSLPPGTTPPEDYPVSVATVHFEFNQDKPTECRVLADELRTRIYYSLWKHVKNLIALYNLPGETAQRCRAYLCLQALEQDLIALTTAVSNHLPHPATPMSLELTGGSSMKVANTASDVECLAQCVNGSAVGQVVPRTGGCFSCLTYYISPGQKADVIGQIHSRPPTGLKEGSESGMLDGYCASVGLRATANGVQYSLPLVSLVNLTKDADGYK